jgi:hypothetical protein
MAVASLPPLQEILTGRPRPRFAETLAELAPGRLPDRRNSSLREAWKARMREDLRASFREFRLSHV